MGNTFRKNKNRNCPYAPYGVRNTFTISMVKLTCTSCKACLARYASLLIFISRLSGTSGTAKSISLPTPNTKCYMRGRKEHKELAGLLKS